MSEDGSPGRCCSQKIDFQMLGESGPPRKHRPTARPEAFSSAQPFAGYANRVRANGAASPS